MVLATLPLLTVHSGSAPEIYVSPANISNAVTNNDYTVNITVANVSDLYAWEFQLNYSATILKVVSYSVVSGGLNTPIQWFENSSTPGHLWVAVSTTYPNETGITYADHAIFQIVFEAIGKGTSSLMLYGDILADHNGNAITHNTVGGSITVGTLDLTVTSVVVLNNGCSIYANDTYGGRSPKSGQPYYVPVNVTIHNTGNMAAGPFNVSLAAIWLTGGNLSDGYGELRVTSLAANTSSTLQFTTVFHPTHTHYYELIAIVDCHNQVVESNKSNNVYYYKPGSGIKVTVIGDINGDGVVNILDAVTIAEAWGSTPSSPNWNIRADINHDGSVDIYDGVRIGLNWGKSW
jgi:hypothetical protein